jgi:hypothetical protein
VPVVGAVFVADRAGLDNTGPLLRGAATTGGETEGFVGNDAIATACVLPFGPTVDQAPPGAAADT